MRKAALTLLLLLALCVSGISDATAKTRPKRRAARPAAKPAPVKVPSGPQPLATLKQGLASSGGPDITRVAGAWDVSSNGAGLIAKAVPMVDAQCLIGPEIREKGAKIEVCARAPGKGRILSRFGMGLYGKNGVQLRTAPARNELELVRRGAVLATLPFEQKLNESLHLELIMKPNGSKWDIDARAWREDEKRPEKPMLEHQIYVADLQTPMAGRSVLEAAAFSGEAVVFTKAEVWNAADAEAASAAKATKDATQ